MYCFRNGFILPKMSTERFKVSFVPRTMKTNMAGCTVLIGFWHICLVLCVLHCLWCFSDKDISQTGINHILLLLNPWIHMKCTHMSLGHTLLKQPWVSVSPWHTTYSNTYLMKGFHKNFTWVCGSAYLSDARFYVPHVSTVLHRLSSQRAGFQGYRCITAFRWAT